MRPWRLALVARLWVFRSRMADSPCPLAMQGGDHAGVTR
jgi:hypothetical protein